MPKLNWRIIGYNLAEAREQLEAVEARVKEGNPPSEIEFQIMLEHAYHHLNFAWNVRHQPSEKHAKLNDKRFNRWSKFPKDLMQDYMKTYKIRKKK